MSALLLLALLAAPGEYRGKYADDARFHAVRDKVPALRAEALARIGEVLGGEAPGPYAIRFVDSGRSRPGVWAETRMEKGAPPVLFLRTEALVLGSHDLEKTLAHELYHCLQRERLGEEGYGKLPAWAREGAAIWVAGQLEDRARALVAHFGADPRCEDPLTRLVDGLGGRHGLEDYAEDACAFEAAQRRHGATKTGALLKRLLETPDAERAVREVLGEDFETFEKKTGTFARELLGSLVEEGRRSVLDGKARIEGGDHAGALDVLRPAGVYRETAAYLRAEALFAMEHRGEALEVVRKQVIARRWRAGAMLADGLLLELKILRAMESPEFAEAAARARLDLEPFPSVYRGVLKVVGRN